MALLAFARRLETESTAILGAAVEPDVRRSREEDGAEEREGG
jgi:hypothetical protein